MTTRHRYATMATVTRAAAKESTPAWVSPMLSGVHGTDAAPGELDATQ